MKYKKRKKTSFKIYPPFSSTPRTWSPFSSFGVYNRSQPDLIPPLRYLDLARHSNTQSLDPLRREPRSSSRIAYLVYGFINRIRSDLIFSSFVEEESCQKMSADISLKKFFFHNIVVNHLKYFLFLPSYLHT